MYYIKEVENTYNKISKSIYLTIKILLGNILNKP